MESVPAFSTDPGLVVPGIIRRWQSIGKERDGLLTERLDDTMAFDAVIRTLWSIRYGKREENTPYSAATTLSPLKQPGLEKASIDSRAATASRMRAIGKVPSHAGDGRSSEPKGPTSRLTIVRIPFVRTLMCPVLRGTGWNVDRGRGSCAT